MRTVREVAIDLFRRHGMTTLFGNPGSTELPMLAPFPDDFRYVLALQEASAVGMADGYAQATGRPALVNLHTAPGVGNAVGALVTAAANFSPLVVTAGQQVRPMMTLDALLTNVRATELPRPWVKDAAEPPRAQDVPAALARALHLATTPPCGPVFVSIPMDDWGRSADEVGDGLLGRRVRARAAPDPAALDELAAALAGARSPALVVGADVDATGGFHDAVALAERLGASVHAPPAGARVGFPQGHGLYRGPLPQAIEPVAQALAEYDVVLVVGAPVFRYYPYVPGPFLVEGTRLWHVTASPDEAARAPVGEALVADPTLTLRALVERIPATARPVPPPPPAPAPPAPGGEGTLSAEEAFDALAAAWPDDGVLVNESPSNLAVQHERLRIDRPRSFYFTSSGGLGFALPAAVGVALAEPARPVVAVIGDGSMQYSIQALATAAALGARVTVVVLDNREYAILKWFADREKVGKAPGLDLPPIDHVGLASAYGVPARSVTTPDELRAAIEQGVAGDGPSLIHVPIVSGRDPR